MKKEKKVADVLGGRENKPKNMLGAPLQGTPDHIRDREACHIGKSECSMSLSTLFRLRISRKLC